MQLARMCSWCFIEISVSNTESFLSCCSRCSLYPKEQTYAHSFTPWTWRCWYWEKQKNVTIDISLRTYLLVDHLSTAHPHFFTPDSSCVPLFRCWCHFLSLAALIPPWAAPFCRVCHPTASTNEPNTTTPTGRPTHCSPTPQHTYSGRLCSFPEKNYFTVSQLNCTFWCRNSSPSPQLLEFTDTVYFKSKICFV